MVFYPDNTLIQSTQKIGIWNKKQIKKRFNKRKKRTAYNNNKQSVVWTASEGRVFVPLHVYKSQKQQSNVNPTFTVHSFSTKGLGSFLGVT